MRRRGGAVAEERRETETEIEREIEREGDEEAGEARPRNTPPTYTCAPLPVVVVPRADGGWLPRGNELYVVLASSAVDRAVAAEPR